jgi:phosphoribosylaminoimidazole (AIR) synthetase
MAEIPDIVLTMGAAHILRIDLASSRSIRRMVNTAMTAACDKARAQGAKPISAVDDLTTHSLGPWVDTFAKHLAGAAQQEGISIVGGEMAQMSDSYAPGYAGVMVSVVSIKS